MSDSVDSTNPGGAAAGEVPPTKHSLRARDAAVTGVTTREEDLAHGPSLLGLGDGQGDPYIDLTWETTENYVPQSGLLSLLPFRLPQPGPTGVISSSEPSHSGPSYTVPAQSVSQASDSHRDEVLLTPTDTQRSNRSLSWIPEFSWQDPHICFDGQDARLCFDDQLLELPATRDGQFSRGGPGSEHEFSISQRSFPRIGGPYRGHDEFQISAIAGIRSFVDSDEHQDENNFDGNSEITSAASSVSSDTSQSEAAFRGEFIDASQPAQEEIACQETVNRIVETLADDYYRSYAPQKRTLAAKRKQADRSSSSSTKNTRATVVRKGAKPTGRRGQTIDGDEGSEDEESRGNGQIRSVTDTSSENSLFWACPFMKWDPRKHRGSCVKKLRDIYRLKKHIQERHFSHHCRFCFKEFRPEELTKHEETCKNIFGLPTRPPPVGLITRDMATAINERSDTRLTPKEQWERLFKIIFPQEPIPLSPYLDYERELVYCYDYFRQPSVKHQVREMIQESQLGHLSKRLMRRAFEQLLAELWDNLYTEDEISAQVASEEETVDQAQPISTMEDDIPENSQTPDSRGFGYDQDELTTFQPSVLIEVDNTTTPIPEPFADQSEIGVGEYLDHLKAIETYGLSCSDVAGIANFEEIGSDPFSRPGAGDLPWYGGQEMFETELDQMRGDQTLFRGA
ncbi:hypothetical protein NOF04DRAFT_5972 [Fusarium oxysporum II5]|uniref:C2H2-type domain-containing protein n=2 Tax=Fusarium oxysporum species complex TaxID=171631 RepID=X0JQ12_FUSO5|nr:uncharacterized protein FOIG_09223 [Fusarium odoratissimum NRRL 54006]EXL98420.1 hypothetical protein FOIG_09223 [Fusarium odoratissimum NRRL 54006]KAK2129440.1 hypothetical protein NOF04DRAFT_5972 [Fusarium oxysporum II5]TXC01747.1 hypothetical protein FocTR4_00008279 [Fusarium oxysporum f. sp. cubense]